MCFFLSLSLARQSKNACRVVVGASGNRVRAETIFIPARRELVFMTRGFKIVYHRKTFPNQRQVIKQQNNLTLKKILTAIVAVM